MVLLVISIMKFISIDHNTPRSLPVTLLPIHIHSHTITYLLFTGVEWKGKLWTVRLNHVTCGSRVT